MTNQRTKNINNDRVSSISEMFSPNNIMKPLKNTYIGGADHIITLCVILLVMFGVIMVFSSSYYTSSRGNGDMFEYLKKELVFASIGFVAMAIGSRIPHRNWARFTKILYIVSCLLLVLVILIGKEVNGAKRWIEIGGFSFQPSEIAKVSTILSLSTLLANNKNLLETPRGLLIYVITFLIPCGLVAVENLSTAIVIGLIGCAMLFVYTPKLSYFIPVVIAGVLGIILMILFSGFRSNRIQAWIDPFSNTSETGWQVVQSLYSIASGGAFGLGLGGSRQKLGYMPEAHNDIIFAIVCEELGWVGAAIVVTIFMVLIWRGVLVAIRHTENPFSMLMATGITSMIAAQVIINIAVVTNTIPNTGIPLPFISYGGTSMVILLFSMGVLLNISKYKKSV